MRWTVLATKAQTASWATPQHVYETLDKEFGFTLDPCPLGAEGGLFGSSDGLLCKWAGQRVYCNPPYGLGIGEWLARAQEADLAVFLLPARTDTRWWHQYAPRAQEVRFVRGRLRFGDGRNSAPFPSVILVFKPEKTEVTP